VRRSTTYKKYHHFKKLVNNMPSNSRVSNIESKHIYLFGEEDTKIDLRIGKKYAELFGDLPN